MYAMDLDFIDPEVEAQMEEEEQEITIRGARGGGRQQFWLFRFTRKHIQPLLPQFFWAAKKISIS